MPRFLGALVLATAGSVSLQGQVQAGVPRPDGSALGFRASLTATVSTRDPREGQARTSDDCRIVELRWRALPDASRYEAYVGASPTGPWTMLPARNRCGAGRIVNPTSVIDDESACPAHAQSRRVFYRIVAFKGPRALETTSAIPVDLRSLKC